MMLNETRRAKLLFIGAMLSFGMIGVIRSFIDLPSSVIALSRGFIASVFLILFIKVRHLDIDKAAVKENFMKLFLSGTAIGVGWIFLFEAYRCISIPKATVFYYLSPVFLMIAAHFFCGEHLTRKKLLCILIAFVGIIFVSGFLKGERITTNDTYGILCAVISALLYAADIILNKKMSRINALDRTVIQMIFVALTLAPYVLVTVDLSSLHFSALSAVLTLFLGVVSTGITYTVYFIAFTHIPAQNIAIYSYIDPISAIIFSAVILGQVLSGFEIIGAVLILFATVIVEIERK